MNRTLTNVLFGGISAPANQPEHKIEGTITKTNVDDTVDSLLNSENVILVRTCFGSFRWEGGLYTVAPHRSLAMVWRLRRLSLRFRTSSGCLGAKTSMSVSRSTP